MLLDMLLLPEHPNAQGSQKNNAMGMVEGLLRRFRR
jgi:hypothetical protein